LTRMSHRLCSASIRRATAATAAGSATSAGDTVAEPPATRIADAVASRGADSLEEAGEALFAFTRLPPSQWKSAQTTNAIERPHEEFKRCIKTQTVLPSAETTAMLFWALLASGQISMRKVDG